MTTIEYHKLVRDRIPHIISSKGDIPCTRIAEPAEYGALLRAKLQEEVAEYLAGSDPHELADILEVLYALCVMHGVTMDDVESWRVAKGQERGVFDERIVLESVETGSP